MMKSGQIIWQGAWCEGDGNLEDFYLKEFGEEEWGETTCKTFG